MLPGAASSTENFLNIQNILSLFTPIYPIHLKRFIFTPNPSRIGPVFRSPYPPALGWCLADGYNRESMIRTGAGAS